MGKNSEFLSVIDPDAKDEILSCIARDYQVSKEKVLAEVTSEEAEPLLDYMKEPHRFATSVLMQRHGFR